LFTFLDFSIISLHCDHPVQLHIVAEGLETKAGGGEESMSHGRAKPIKNIFLRPLHDVDQHGVSWAENVPFLKSFWCSRNKKPSNEKCGTNA